MSYTECTCYRVWQSITPPPVCPMHAHTGWTMPSTTWTSTWGTRGEPCPGRHCRHDMICGSWVKATHG